MRWSLPAAILAVALLSLLSAGPEAGAQGSTTTIEVDDFYFCDASFSSGVCETDVTEGDTVLWQWVGGGNMHSTTECGDDVDTCPAPHLWDSGIQDSGTFAFTFDTAGSYAYRCQVHPQQMRGVVNVQGAAQPTATAAPTATATPADAGTGVTPAAVPDSGGPPPDGGAGVGSWLALIAGGLVLAAAGALVIRARRGAVEQ